MNNVTSSKVRSINSKKVHAKRTPEEKKKVSESISKGVKKWHAEMSEKKKQAKNRKMSKTQQQRCSEIPPRMKRDINRKKSISFRKFDASLAGREQRKYLGYLSSMDILNCPIDKKNRIIEKRRAGQQKKWDSLDSKARALRISKTLGMIKIKDKMAKKELFFERNVPREKNYCGVVTTEEMEQMYA